jgi:transcriptional regulator with XRE-family HTH domain
MEFAERVGIHFTTASRLRNGQRVPSTALLARIAREFDIKGEDLLTMIQTVDETLPGVSAVRFGAWLREHVFAERIAA